MKLDPNRYTASYPFVKRLYDQKIREGSEQIDAIANVAIASMVPVLAVSLYIERECGTNESLQNSIVLLTTFYQYTNIIPWE